MAASSSSTSSRSMMISTSSSNYGGIMAADAADPSLQVPPSCRCVVPNCGNEFYKTKLTGQQVHYHSLPRGRSDLLRRWMAALRLREELVMPLRKQLNCRVCSAHFTDDDYVQRRQPDGDLVRSKSNRLKPDAVPSVLMKSCGAGEGTYVPPPGHPRGAAIEWRIHEYGRKYGRWKTPGQKQQRRMAEAESMTTEDMAPEDMETTSWDWGGDPSDGTTSAEAAPTGGSGTAAATTPSWRAWVSAPGAWGSAPGARAFWGWAPGASGARGSAPGAWGSAPGARAAAHLQCPLCGHFSKSHAHLLTHAADVHPEHLDGVPVGRLGNIMVYQSTAGLFHCFQCYFTTKYFPSLYDHIVTTHCMDHGRKDGAGGGEDGEKLADYKADEAEEEGEADEVGKKADSVKRKRSSEGDDDEDDEEEREEEDDIQKESDATGDVPTNADASDESKGVLRLDGDFYCCQVCDFKTQLKGTGILHVVKKHKIPRAYAYATAPTKQSQQQPSSLSSSCSNEEEAGSHAMMATAATLALMSSSSGGGGGGGGSGGDLLSEEMKARAKVVSYAKSRYVCLLCGWKTKSKGIIFSHVARTHDVERPYSCKECQLSFFLPSYLQQHMSTQHRAGCYGCPFCSFRSVNMGGFKRHCRCCAAREEGEEEEGGGGAEEKGEEEAAGEEASDGEEGKGEGAGASDGEEEKGEEESNGELEKGDKKVDKAGQEKGEGAGASDGEEEGEEESNGEQEKGDKKGQKKVDKAGQEKGEYSEGK